MPGISKAVISLWFRAPTASVNSAYNNLLAVNDSIVSDGGGVVSPALAGIIPLITFGTSSSSPSYVGLQVGLGVDAVKPCVNMQMAETAIGQTGGGVLRPDAYYLQPNAVVTPDFWHHLLVSFNLRGGSASMGAGLPADFHIGSWSDLWLAFDDQNYTDWGGVDHWGDLVVPPEGIMSQGVLNLEIGTSATSSLSAAPIQTSGLPIGIPTDARYVSSIYDVFMAEMQVFTGVTLDTSNVANRRAFIDSTGSPVNPNTAKALLGKAPDILLSGFKKWKAGTNAGTLGPFTATGTIKSFAKNPRLGT